MKKTILAGFVALATLAALSSAHAQLTLNLDTVTKDFWFTGTATGTADTSNGYGEVRWDAGSVSGTFNNKQFFDSQLVVAPGNGYYYTIVAYANLVSFSGGATTVTLNLDPAYNGISATFTGTGVKDSYAGWNLGNIAALESYIGGSLPLVGGSTGFGPLNVVPEPHEYALMAGLGLIGFAGFRRWRQRA
jgi:hypothetical protein